MYQTMICTGTGDTFRTGLSLTIFHSMLQNEETFFLLNLFDQHRQKRLWLKLQHGGPFQTLLQYVVELCQHDP